MATKQNIIDIKPIEFGYVDFTIKGTSPLIVHAWSEKAKRIMLETQTKGNVRAKREAKIPTNDFMATLYWLTDVPEWGGTEEEAEELWIEATKKNPRFGFPCNGIKASIISGAYRAGLDVKQTELRSSFFLEGATDVSTPDFAEIVGEIPIKREDMVKVGGQSKTADIRYRASFESWEIPLRMKYLKDGKYSINQLMNMINYGGFCTGIGEWRPEKKGQFGMYELKLD